MDQDEILQLLTNPFVHPEEKKKLLTQLQAPKDDSFALGTTLSALGTDVALGTALSDYIEKKFPNLGSNVAKEGSILNSLGVKPHTIRGGAGHLAAGTTGLLGALGYHALSNYFDPLEN